MYLKTVKSKNHIYLKICKSYRENGKVHQKVIANLGRLDHLIEGGLENIAYDLLNLASKEKKHKFKDITKMQEINRYNYGYISYAKLWNILGITKILNGITKEKKIEFSLSKTVFSMVVNRLLDPSSKLYHFNHKDRYLFINEDIELHNIYRSLDILAENKEEIEYKLFEKKRNLFNMKLDVVFYDVTTFYFESREVDELKNFGFSKENKVNEVQVVMGLLIDKEGVPIGYEIFRGNTIDSKTMINIIKKLKKKFQIDKIIIVADKGLNSKMNLKEIKENGFEYIVSGRLKQMPKSIQEKVFDMAGYKKDKNNKFEYKEINYINKVSYIDEKGNKIIENIEEKIICTYSKEREIKDRAERERLVEKAKKVIMNNQKWILENKKGHRKYIEKEYNNGDSNYILKLCEEKIEEEKKFDGYYVIESSDLTLDAYDIIEAYHNLWKIEESFRIMKSTMKVRPIFHWTHKRIEGHFVMCFIAFLLERELELRLRNNKKVDINEVSVEKIKEALNSMEVSELDIEKERVFLKGKHKSLGSKIFSILKIPHLKNISSLDDLKNWYNEFQV